jgi:hypothetical protein
MLGCVSWYYRAIHGPRSLEALRGNAKGFLPRYANLATMLGFVSWCCGHPWQSCSARLLRAVALHLSPTQHSGQGARALRAGVAGQRSHGWQSAGSVERAKAWRAAASVRRQSMGTMTHARPRRSFLKNSAKDHGYLSGHD